MAVTAELRLPPDYQHRSGEPRLVRTSKGQVQEYGPHQFGLWSMSSENWVKSPRLETHINWLLSQVEPRMDEVQRLIANGAMADFFCYSRGYSDVPPAIPQTIKDRAAALGIRIEIDHYLERDSTQST